MSASTDWQLGKTLAECNEYMLRHKLGCDVSFNVGPEGEETEIVEAHKYMLVSRSPVFFSMFYGDLAETVSPIRIPDLHPDIFRDILTYIYCDTIVKDHEKLESFLYGGEKYMLPGMVKAYTQWIDESINQETVCSALNCSNMFNKTDLWNKALEFFFNNAQQILQSESFSKLSPESLKLILSSNDLDVDEANIYEACLRWGEEHCIQSNLDTTDANIRHALSGNLFLIRFPLISGPRFVRLTKGSHVLTAEEKLLLQEYFITNEELSTSPFSAAPRGKLPTINRFQRVSDCGAWDCNEGKVDAISFNLSCPIHLKGIMLFGGKAPTTHLVSVELLYDDHSSLVFKKGKMESFGKPDPIPFRFEKSIYLQPGTDYVIKVSMEGDPVYRGVDGRNVIEYKGLKITFSNSRLSKNGTEKLCGQIPGFIFRMTNASALDKTDGSTGSASVVSSFSNL